MRSRLMLGLAVGVALASGCDRSSAPQSPTPVQSPSLVEISMCCGKGQVFPGDSVQLQVTGRFSDGSLADITSRSKWESSNAAVATVSTTGFVSFTQQGDVRISATYQNTTIAWLVSVQAAPAGE